MTDPMGGGGESRPRRSMPWGDLPRGEFPGDGLVIVDKDRGVTSHDVVGAMRRLAGTRKVGHAGTLDPMATGVLAVGIGRATKLLQYVTGTDKEYLATIRFGIETSTEDAEGEVVARHGASGFDTAQLETAMAELAGEISQVPSSVSALKVGGRRAYELVREGHEVALQARPVTIHAFEACAPPRQGTDGDTAVVDLDVRVECSAGTYIRALARDLGALMGTGAHLTALRRTRVGTWDADGSLSVREQGDRVASGAMIAYVPLAELVRGLFPRVEVSEAEAADLAMGRFIEQRPWGQGPQGARSAGIAAAWVGDRPVALVSVKRSQLKPDLLLTPGV